MMNKIYTVLVLFAISGLLFANIPAPSYAAPNLDYMLAIAENAKKWCKSEIEARESVDPKILEFYLQSLSEIEKLSLAIDAGDVSDARKHFVSAMQNMREISLMINQLEISEVESKLTISRNPVLDRFEMNIQKLKSISIKLGANIDFYEIENLMKLAKENHENGNTQNVKNLTKEIAEKGTAIYQTLTLINEKNKIIRAKTLAEKHIQKANILIMQAKELGMQDAVSKLEQSKASLVSSNSTSQIKHSIKVIIVLNKTIQKSQSEAMEDAKRIELHLSEREKASMQLSQLETKANILSVNSQGSNIAIYYLEKTESLIESAKLQLEDPSNDISAEIKKIERFLLKIEKLLQKAA